MAVHGFVANTDWGWFRFLREQGRLDEVNFWFPSERQGFKAIPPHSPFFFRLKAPRRVIGGVGVFARYSRQRAWTAWQAFEAANGAPTYEIMLDRIAKYRSPDRRDPYGRYEIGCLVVIAPIFFPESLWVRGPSGWSDNIVRGKTFDLELGEGKRIWRQCQANAALLRPELFQPSSEPRPRPRFGSPYLAQARLGQGAFRIAVTDAYSSACAVSREHSLPVLEAAHIRRYADGGSHDVRNGILLRSDIHRLFDQGYVTVSSDHHIEVSDRLRLDYENGHSYYPFHGQKLWLPRERAEWPERSALEWHQDNVYLGTHRRTRSIERLDTPVTGAGSESANGL